ncbi:MAG: hypothetical protein MZV63_54255 [Marinilabiliales bacterium]|nr:hypothetical protein [Marinilabiliales bacterium]
MRWLMGLSSTRSIDEVFQLLLACFPGHTLHKGAGRGRAFDLIGSADVYEEDEV